MRGSPSIPAAVRLHLASMRAECAAPATISGRARLLRDFIRFARARRLSNLGVLTAQALASYQLYLADSSQRRTQALSLSSLRQRLIALRQLLRWAARTANLDPNLAGVLRIPKAPAQVPRAILTLDEAERILQCPNIKSADGLRDRAILELLFSSGLRRMELLGADLADLDLSQQQLLIREGKGRRDRVVPVTPRATHWLSLYLSASRPALARESVTAALFITARGDRISRTRLGVRLRSYLVTAGVQKPGACHIWRHTVATLMHDGGADIRDLQQLLGHATLSTTAIYTRVSVARLADVLGVMT